MKLYIDTSDTVEIKVALEENDKIIREAKDNNKYGSQALLPLIWNLLKMEKKELKDLKEIKVATGPGSFTGLKVGAAVGNTLAFALNIPVNGKKVETEIIY